MEILSTFGLEIELLPVNFTDFLVSQHILHLATSQDNTPWVAACFYALDTDSDSLIIASSLSSRHLKEALISKKVAGSIALQTDKVNHIEGVQFEGELSEATKLQKQLYYKKYPYALIMRPKLWSILINRAKLTKNRLGFGHKEYFTRQEKMDPS